MPFSPYRDDVYYWITQEKLEDEAGTMRVDRNHVMDLRSPRSHQLELVDEYYLMIINMS